MFSANGKLTTTLNFLQNNIEGSPVIFQFPTSILGKSTPALNILSHPSDLEDPRSLLKWLKLRSLEQTKIIAGFILPRMTGNQILDRI